MMKTILLSFLFSYKVALSQTNISYNILQKEIDGGYADLTPTKNPNFSGRLNFLFEEEYVDNGTRLDYKIFRMDRTVVAGTPVLPVAYKENRYTINLSAIGFSQTNSYYILEVTDKKGEKNYLRFKF